MSWEKSPPKLYEILQNQVNYTWQQEDISSLAFLLEEPGSLKWK